MLYTQTVSPETLDLIKRLSADEQLREFNLVGGTALALQVGHRTSIDIDLFTTKNFSAEELNAYLSDHYGADTVRVLKNGIYTFIEDVKVDIIAHQYPLIAPIVAEDSVRMASLEDIGAMKLHAIVESGKRLKDFIDMHVLLERHPLKTYLQAYEDKYGLMGKIAPKNALLYHKDIDFSPPVAMTDGSLHWQSIDKRLREAAAEPEKIFASATQIATTLSESETKKTEHLRQLKKTKIQNHRRRPRL
jgi:hypothetical protein